MKDNIAYIYGRCYGLQNTLAGPKYDPTASKIQRAVQYPMSGFALINQYLIAERKMTEEADRRIAELVDEIRELDIEPGQPEKILPLEQQNAWWLGYYHETTRIKKEKGKDDKGDFGSWMVERRKAKGMSQLELAEKVGTQQSTISRIEKGQMMPGVWLEKIEEALK